MSTIATVLPKTDIVHVLFDTSKSYNINNQRCFELYLCVDACDIRCTIRTDDYFYLYLNRDDNFPKKTKYKFSDIKKLENDEDGVLIIFRPLSETYNYFDLIYSKIWKDSDNKKPDYTFLKA